MKQLRSNTQSAHAGDLSRWNERRLLLAECIEIECLLYNPHTLRNHEILEEISHSEKLHITSRQICNMKLYEISYTQLRDTTHHSHTAHVTPSCISMRAAPNNTI